MKKLERPMSKNLTLDELEITDQALLVATLEEDMTFRGCGKGASVENHRTSQHLFGYAGDQRKETAEVIVRREFVGGASNDLGFKRQESGRFSPIISAFDSRYHNAAWLDELSQRYSERRYSQDMYQQGYALSTSVPNADGSTSLVFVAAGTI
jgi:hypothetical protein